MAWFWFTIVILMFVAEMRQYFKQQQAFRIVASSYDALVVSAAERGEKGHKIAYDFLTNIEYVIRCQDYEKFMDNVCKTHGLIYIANGEGEGTTIDENLKDELSRRIGLEIEKTANYVRNSKSSL